MANARWRSLPGPALLSWPQLATHFGNQGNKIRKFRQTIRDAWEGNVSAVYPEARAEFDTTAIKLHGSPPPLQRRALSLATIKKQVTVAEGSSAPHSEAECFLEAIKTSLGTVLARAWVSDATLDVRQGETFWCSDPSSKADYVRQNFAGQVERVAGSCGLNVTPTIITRSNSPPL